MLKQNSITMEEIRQLNIRRFCFVLIRHSDKINIFQLNNDVKLGKGQTRAENQKNKNRIILVTLKTIKANKHTILEKKR